MARPAGGRMAEGHRKQKGSWAWRASPSGISACFPENPAGRLLRNHSRFHGVVSADPAGLFRADGEREFSCVRFWGTVPQRRFAQRSRPRMGKDPRLLSRDGPAFAPGRRQDARLRPLQPKSGNKFRPLGKTPVPFTNAYD